MNAPPAAPLAKTAASRSQAPTEVPRNLPAPLLPHRLQQVLLKRLHLPLQPSPGDCAMRSRQLQAAQMSTRGVMTLLQRYARARFAPAACGG